MFGYLNRLYQHTMLNYYTALYTKKILEEVRELPKDDIPNRVTLLIDEYSKAIREEHKMGDYFTSHYICYSLSKQIIID